MSEEKGLEINWTRSAGGALGAVSSAVLLSTFGVAGTLIGAAIGSLIISVGGAFYAHSMSLAKDRLEIARVKTARSRLRAHGDPASETDASSAELTEADESEEAEEDPVDQPAGSWRDGLRGLPWKHITIVTVALFVVAMAIIVVFELTAGRTVSSFTGGDDSDRRTSIPGSGRRTEDTGTDDKDKQPDQQPDQESDEPTPDQQESPSPSESDEPAPDESSPSTPAPDAPSEPVPNTPAPPPAEAPAPPPAGE